jgi:hypothetical protein
VKQTKLRSRNIIVRLAIRNLCHQNLRQSSTGKALLQCKARFGAADVRFMAGHYNFVTGPDGPGVTRAAASPILPVARQTRG